MSSYHTNMTGAGASMSHQSATEVINDVEAEQMVRDHVERQYALRFKTNGVVTGEDACKILQSVGLQAEEVDVRPMVPDWSNVPLELMHEIVTTARLTQNADVGQLIKFMENDVIRLHLCDWIMYKLPCTEKDPDWQYRTIQLEFNVPPRYRLFASTGIVLLLTGMAILLLMSLLWLQQAADREKVQLKNFHLLLSSFSQSFEQSFIRTHGDTMVDQVDTLAKLVEKQYDLRLVKWSKDLGEDATLMASLLEIAGADVENNLAAPINGSLASLLNLLAADTAGEITKADVISMINQWNADFQSSTPWETVAVQYTGATASVVVESATLECAYGSCEYTVVPCLSPSLPRNALQFFMKTFNVHRDPVIGVAVFLTRFNMSVCSTLELTYVTSARIQSLVTAAKSWNDIFTDTYYSRREIILARVTNWTNQKVEWLSDKIRVEDACYAAGTCLGLDSLIRVAIQAGQTVQQITTGYSGESLYAAASPTSYGIAVATSMRAAALADEMRNEVVSVINYLNFNSDRSTELSLGMVDATTGVINPQLNQFRFTSGCYGPCIRREAASVAATKAIQTTGTGWLISPDYRPEPVLAAYSFVTHGINMAIVIERDVQEIRKLGLAALTGILEDNNAQYSGSLEAQFVRYAGWPAMMTYDRFAACDYIKECVSIEGGGVVYRSDCVHCTRAPILTNPKIEFITKQKHCPNCSRTGSSSGIAFHPLSERNEDSRTIYTTDYRGVNVLAVYSYVKNFSVGLIVKLDRSEIENPITKMIGIAVGIAIAIVMAGLASLIFFSRIVLDKIEQEWLDYKEQIDKEKLKFDNMVKDVVPREIADGINSGSQQHAASIPSLSFVFLDIVGMTERTKTWAPEQVCRYLTYIFSVVEHTCMVYQMNKVRMFGDSYFAVGGIVGEEGLEPCAVRAAKFGAIVLQLVSPKFAHFPDSIPLIRESFQDVVQKFGPSFPDVSGSPADVGYVFMPPMRIGMHYGAGTYCVIETGRTPTFEVFGPGVALAHRMQATSQPNRMHVTGAMKDAIERDDVDQYFEFEPPRKTVVKAQGTITSYFVGSANVAVPVEILEDLGISYSNLRVFYEKEDGVEK